MSAITKESRGSLQRASMIRGGFSELKSGGNKKKKRMAAWTTAEGNSPRAGNRGLICARDNPGTGLFRGGYKKNMRTMPAWTFEKGNSPVDGNPGLMPGRDKPGRFSIG